MIRQPIPVTELQLQPFTAFDPNGVLLVSGRSIENSNTMTISWGMFGIMWGKPVVMVMVRPSRHTWEFITNAPDFTLNRLPDEMFDVLGLCGSRSGRDIDKYAVSGIHPVASTSVASPIIEESILALECRTLYRSDLDPARFLDPAIDNWYLDQSFHGLFFGEVVAAAGTEQFRRV